MPSTSGAVYFFERFMAHNKLSPSLKWPAPTLAMNIIFQAAATKTQSQGVFFILR